MTFENATIFVQPAEANQLGDIWIPLIVGLAGVAVSLIIFWFQRKSYEATNEAEKQKTRLAAVAEAFRLLNDVRHREARKVLYDTETSPNTFNKSSFVIMDIAIVDENGDSNLEALKDVCKNIVRSDFNEIGTLIHYDMLDGKIFIEEYYWVILKIWSLLKDDIQKRRQVEGRSNYMEHLESMEKKAAGFVKEKYPGVYARFY
jgi:hypothetical protein